MAKGGIPLHALDLETAIQTASMIRVQLDDNDAARKELEAGSPQRAPTPLDKQPIEQRDPEAAAKLNSQILTGVGMKLQQNNK